MKNDRVCWEFYFFGADSNSEIQSSGARTPRTYLAKRTNCLEEEGAKPLRVEEWINFQNKNMPNLFFLLGGKQTAKRKRFSGKQLDSHSKNKVLSSTRIDWGSLSSAHQRCCGAAIGRERSKTRRRKRLLAAEMWMSSESVKEASFLRLPKVRHFRVECRQPFRRCRRDGQGCQSLPSTHARDTQFRTQKPEAKSATKRHHLVSFFW